MIKFENVEVNLIGMDSNAFAIVGRVMAALKKSGISKEEIEEYRNEATAGDYDNLLRVTTQWVSIV